MENMLNIGNLFALSRDPVVGAENGSIAYMNPAATALLGSGYLGLPEQSLFPPHLLDVVSDNFVVSIKIKDQTATVSRTSLFNLNLYCFILAEPPEDENNKQAITSSLRELSNGIKLTSDLITGFSMEYEDTRLSRYSATLSHYSAKMNRLVKNYALYSAFKENAQPFNPVMESIRSICQNICTEIERFSLPRNVSIEYRDQGDILACVDTSLLSQMLLNVVSNSLNHMPDGGTILVESKGTRQHITISVEDTGTGIPPNLLVDIFNSFNRDNILAADGVNAGLGLAVADAVAKIHGGTLIIESKVGQGTKVTMHIPRVTDHRLNSPKISFPPP